eukprot:580769_1
MPAKPEKRLRRELERLTKEQVPGCAAKLRSNNIFEWEAYIEGPKDSPFEGGIFHLYINFPQNYPIKPPNVTFKTKIYHCNIKSSNGEICLDVLKDNYSPALTIEKILLSLCALLQEPNPDDPLVADIAKVLLIDKDAHNNTAKEWTRRYAMVDKNQNNNTNNN